MAERSLNAIIEDINTAIKTASFGGKITTRGLCYLQEKDGKTFPIENINTRNARKISWDDKYPLQTYHRILETEKETDVTQGFGAKASRTRTYTMRLVGIGSKTALSSAGYEDNQEIAKTIADILPSFISSTEYTQVTGMEVIKQEVYDSEWAGVEIKKLSLEGVAFWVDYVLKIANCGSGSTTINQSTVRNTDNSYSDQVNCGQTLTLPDITITKLDDSTITYPAAKALDIGDVDSCEGVYSLDDFITSMGAIPEIQRANVYAGRDTELQALTPVIGSGTPVNNGATFDSDGFTGNGTSAYIDSDWSPGIQGTWDTQMWCGWVSVAKKGTLMGVLDYVDPNYQSIILKCQYAVGIWSFVPYDSALFSKKVNISTDNNFDASSEYLQDLFIVYQWTEAGNVELWMNGRLAVSFTIATLSSTNGNIFELAENSYGSPAFYSASTIGFSAYGTAMSRADIETLYESTKKYIHTR